MSGSSTSAEAATPLASSQTDLKEPAKQEKPAKSKAQNVHKPNLSEEQLQVKRDKQRLKRQQKNALRKQSAVTAVAAAEAVKSESAGGDISKPPAVQPVLSNLSSSSSFSSSSTLVNTAGSSSSRPSTSTSVHKVVTRQSDQLDDMQLEASHVEDWAAEEVSMIASQPSGAVKSGDATPAAAISVGHPSGKTKQKKPKPKKAKKEPAVLAVPEAAEAADPATPEPEVVTVADDRVSEEEARLAAKRAKQAEKNRKRKEKKLQEAQQQKLPGSVAEAATDSSVQTTASPAEPDAQTSEKQTVASSAPATTKKPPKKLVGSATSKFATAPSATHTSLPISKASKANAVPYYASGPHSDAYLYNEPGSRTLENFVRKEQTLAMRISLKPIPGLRQASLDDGSRRKLRNKSGVVEIEFTRVLKEPVGDKVSVEKQDGSEKVNVKIGAVVAAPEANSKGKQKQVEQIAETVLQPAEQPQSVATAAAPSAATSPVTNDGVAEGVSLQQERESFVSAPAPAVPSFISALDKRSLSTASSSSFPHVHAKALSTASSTAPSTTVPTPPPSQHAGVRPVVFGETTFYTSGSSPRFGVSALHDDPAVISAGTPRKQQRASGFVPAHEVQRPKSDAAEAQKASELFMRRFVPDYKEESTPTAPQPLPASTSLAPSTSASAAMVPMYSPAVMPMHSYSPMPMYDAPTMPWYAPGPSQQQAFYGPDGQLYLYSPGPAPTSYYPSLPYNPAAYAPHPYAGAMSKFIANHPYDSPPVSPHQPQLQESAQEGTPMQTVTSNGTTYFLPAAGATSQGYQGPVRDLEEFVQIQHMQPQGFQQY